MNVSISRQLTDSTASKRKLHDLADDASALTLSSVRVEATENSQQMGSVLNLGVTEIAVKRQKEVRFFSTTYNASALDLLATQAIARYEAEQRSKLTSNSVC